jgi:hypothetical protein
VVNERHEASTRVRGAGMRSGAVKAKRSLFDNNQTFSTQYMSKSINTKGLTSGAAILLETASQRSISARISLFAFHTQSSARVSRCVSACVISVNLTQGFAVDQTKANTLVELHAILSTLKQM